MHYNACFSFCMLVDSLSQRSLLPACKSIQLQGLADENTQECSTVYLWCWGGLMCWGDWLPLMRCYIASNVRISKIVISELVLLTNIQYPLLITIQCAIVSSYKQQFYEIAQSNQSHFPLRPGYSTMLTSSRLTVIVVDKPVRPLWMTLLTIVLLHDKRCLMINRSPGSLVFGSTSIQVKHQITVLGEEGVADNKFGVAAVDMCLDSLEGAPEFFDYILEVNGRKKHRCELGLDALDDPFCRFNLARGCIELRNNLRRR